MIDVRSAYRRVRALQWISPGSFALCGITFVGVYAILHLLGLREYTSILCGTLPADRTEQVIVGFGGVSYTIFHMLAVLAAPILVIAAGLFAAAQTRLLREPRDPASWGRADVHE